MRKEQIVVTGMGAVTSNGANVTEFFQRSMTGQRGITDSPCPVFDTSKLLTQFWGKADSFCGYDPASFHTDRATALAQQAAAEAMEDASITRQELRNMGSRAALILGSLSYDDYPIANAAAGGADVRNGQDGQDADAQDGHSKQYMEHIGHPSSYALAMKDFFGVAGACYDFSSACSSGTAAIGCAADLIRSGQCDIAIVCGTDALSPMVACGFHSLKALSSHLCLPLDENRDGINIGEGSGVLIMESASHAAMRHADAYAECVSVSTGNEAFHITSPDTTADGFYRSMKTALDHAHLSPEDIDYVNLHGTGTPINDATELTALNRLYETADRRPYLSSLKTLIGHCMGAAGILEAIMTVLCLTRQEFLPAHHVKQPLKELGGFSIVPPERGSRLQYALSNSFAFAGNTASVIFGQTGERQTLSGTEADRTNALAETETDVADTSAEIPVWINGIGILTPQIPDIAQWKNILGEDLSCDEQPQPISAPLPGIPAKKVRGANHLSRLVLSSALQAEQDSGLCHDEWEQEQIGTFFSSAFGAVSERLAYEKTVSQGEPDLCSPTVFANISPNAPLGHLCINLHCKGPSASFHGASPLTPSILSLKNGFCQTVLSCMAEEYEPLMEKAYGKTYQESGVTLLLQNQKTEHSYCRIAETTTCDMHSPEAFRPVSSKPELILVCGASSLTEEMRDALRSYYSGTPLFSTDAVLGRLAGSSCYANIALAAICLKEQSLPPAILTEDRQPITSILAVGSDSCENLHQVLLTGTN